MALHICTLGAQAANDPRGLVGLSETKADVPTNGNGIGGGHVTQEDISVDFPAGTAGHAEIQLYNAAGTLVLSQKKLYNASLIQMTLVANASEGSQGNGWKVSTTSFGAGSKIKFILSGKLGAGVSATMSHTSGVGPATPYQAVATGNGYVEIDVPFTVVDL